MINDTNNIMFCSISCGNNMHKNCFEKWRKAKLLFNEPVTCPFCRIEWKMNTEATNNHSNGYLNLATYSTTHDYDEDDDDWMFYHY